MDWFLNDIGLGREMVKRYRDEKKINRDKDKNLNAISSMIFWNITAPF